MISGTLSLLFALALATAEPPHQDSPDLEIEGLLAALAAEAGQELAFEETRHSELLAEPLTVSGRLHRDDQDRLIRITEGRRPETHTLAERYVEIRRADRSRQRFSLVRAPELGVLREALLAILDGDAARLKQSFDVELEADNGGWRLNLVPLDPDLAERVKRLTLLGIDQELTAMSLHLDDGEIIETRFLERQ